MTSSTLRTKKNSNNQVSPLVDSNFPKRFNYEVACERGIHDFRTGIINGVITVSEITGKFFIVCGGWWNSFGTKNQWEEQMAGTGNLLSLFPPAICRLLAQLRITLLTILIDSLHQKSRMSLTKLSWKIYHWRNIRLAKLSLARIRLKPEEDLHQVPIFSAWNNQNYKSLTKYQFCLASLLYCKNGRKSISQIFLK